MSWPTRHRALVVYIEKLLAEYERWHGLVAGTPTWQTSVTESTRRAARPR
ncbi:hypothetical protein MMMB2_2208 [Mycobacterium marinum MB2]|nr:hypothetical protein MMMB2_2208 [Mycobacterium marinum MB2]